TRGQHFYPADKRSAVRNSPPFPFLKLIASLSLELTTPLITYEVLHPRKTNRLGLPLLGQATRLEH
ncbi:hypothetical protein LINPERHAP2_LOCUS11298, partial [Linum perenne]